MRGQNGLGAALELVSTALQNSVAERIDVLKPDPGWSRFHQSTRTYSRLPVMFACARHSSFMPLPSKYTSRMGMKRKVLLVNAAPMEA